jgi:hypothetical protein
MERRQEEPHAVVPGGLYHACLTDLIGDGQGIGVAMGEGHTHMRWENATKTLTILGLGAMLTVSMGARGMAGAAAQGSAQSYAGQVREIKIDRCSPQPGTCEGSMVLAQARGQEVALAIVPATPIQRGEQRVYLDELGIGNYVTVWATPLPRKAREWGDNKVGTSPGERPLRLHETDEE